MGRRGGELGIFPSPRAHGIGDGIARNFLKFQNPYVGGKSSKKMKNFEEKNNVKI
mgnify:CR=1 FL=1